MNYICNCNDEYAENMKEKKSFMYKRYTPMTQEDFMNLLGMLIHFGYRKIPQYRLAWSSGSLCYDPFIASVISRNKFESLLCFLHVVDKKKEEQLKKDKDKLAKVISPPAKGKKICVHRTLTFFIDVCHNIFGGRRGGRK